VAAGQVWVGAPIMDRLIQRIQPTENDAKTALLEKLTDREREIAELIGQGLGNKMIARQLDISERTVKAHLSAIFQKTGVKDRLQLALRIK
jgi:DNA-binding NarL/FixJ family response regulator